MKCPNVAINSHLSRFDFSTYGFFAKIIGDEFFPQFGENSRLAMSFVTFGAAFLSRPLGALFLGSFGDKYGPKLAIENSLILIGCSSAIIGCLPTYKSAGPIAPILLFTCRFLQGFAVGGTTMSTTIYAVKDQKENRALTIAVLQSVTNLGMFLGNLVSVVLRTIFDNDQLHDYGWRIPFWIGSIVVVSGIYLKLCGDENDGDPDFDHKTHLKEVFSRKNLKPMTAALFVAAFSYIGMYMLFTWTVHLMASLLKPPVPHAFIVSLISIGISIIIFLPVAGIIADRGNKLYLLAISISLFGMFFPLLIYLIEKFRNPLLCGILLTLAGFGGAISAPCIFLYFEKKFPQNKRVTTIYFAMQTSSAVFGGFAPAIATVLFKINKLLPSAMTTITAIISLTALYFTETRLPIYEDDASSVNATYDTVNTDGETDIDIESTSTNQLTSSTSTKV